MKKINQILAAILALVLLLTGCGTKIPSLTDETAGTMGTTDTTGTTENVEPVITCQYLPEKVENPENLPVLKWVCLTERAFGGGVRTWNETAAQEVNQMLAEKEMPFRVQFVLLAMDQGLIYLDWFSYPEAQEALKDADLIYGSMTADEMVQYLSPITEYVTGTAEPTLKSAAAHEKNWIAGTVDGEVYGIITIPAKAYSNGWRIDPELLAASGLTVEDFDRDFCEMDQVMEKLYQANGNKPCLYIHTEGTMSTSNAITGELGSVWPSAMDGVIPEDYDLVGSCFAVDHGAQTPKVVNVLETDAVQKLQEAILRYRKAGYISGNQLSAKLRYTSVMGNTPYVDTFKSGDVCIPVTDAYVSATSPGGHVSGVAAVSQNKQEAVQLLNLIAEDEAFRMQLFYGKEGRDYKVEDGYYSIIKQEDGSNYSMDFLSPLAYFAGLTSEMMTADFMSPGTENWALVRQEGETVLQTYQDTLDQCGSYYPIVFDYTGLEQELNAIQTVCQKYFPIFTTSQMTQDVYAQMLQEMKIAGSDKVIAQLQRQLETWQSANPDW